MLGGFQPRLEAQGQELQWVPRGLGLLKRDGAVEGQSASECDKSQLSKSLGVEGRVGNPNPPVAVSYFGGTSSGSMVLVDSGVARQTRSL